MSGPQIELELEIGRLTLAGLVPMCTAEVVEAIRSALEAQLAASPPSDSSAVFCTHLRVLVDPFAGPGAVGSEIAAGVMNGFAHADCVMPLTTGSTQSSGVREEGLQ